MEVRMSGLTNKCNYPGACRIVDAYFRLNLAWWVWFYGLIFNFLAFSYDCVQLFVRSVYWSWDFVSLPYSCTFRLFRNRIHTYFKRYSDFLFYLAASVVISASWFRTIRWRFTVPVKMRWLRPFRQRYSTWIQSIPFPFTLRMQLCHMRFVYFSNLFV